MRLPVTLNGAYNDGESQGISSLAAFQPLYTSPEISVFKFVGGPGMFVPPHDHLMWAINGIYTGDEDNVSFRRTNQSITQSGGRRVLLKSRQYWALM